MNKIVLLALAALAGGTSAYAADATPVSSPIAGKTYDLPKIFAGKLTDAAGKPVKSDDIGTTPYTIVYFSAHWCPPCRAFTPKLVKFVNEKRKDGNFSVVLVSSDQSAEKMHEYIKVTSMPWDGVLGKNVKSSDIGKGVEGIPCLRVFDKAGKIVLDTYDAKGEYAGPDAVLEAFAAKLK